MKKSIILFLCMISVFFGCEEKAVEKPVWHYTNVLATVSMDADSNLPMVITDEETFYVPDLLDKITFQEGDMYFVSFDYDFGNQPNSGYFTASNFTVDGKVQKINSVGISIDALTDDYAEIISTARYIGSKNDLLFFECKTNGATNQTYDFEAVYIPEEGSRTTDLYIRAKVSEPLSTGENSEISSYIGVDLSGLIADYKDKGIAQITIYFKYKTAEDILGDIYTDLGSYTKTL